jgi:phenylalanyl-tRNA synthetase beta chain
MLGQKRSTGDREFYEIKGVVDQLLESFRIADHWYDDAIPDDTRATDIPFLHPHRSAMIRIGNTLVGYVGELHPGVSSRMKTKSRIALAELYVDVLTTHINDAFEFKPIPKYPSIMRDIALVVPSEERVDDVIDAIEMSGGTLLVRIELIDYFEDDVMRSSGEKSLAFHLLFQSDERTLQDDEIKACMERIGAATNNRSWRMR